LWKPYKSLFLEAASLPKAFSLRRRWPEGPDEVLPQCEFAESFPKMQLPAAHLISQLRSSGVNDKAFSSRRRWPEGPDEVLPQCEFAESFPKMQLPAAHLISQLR